MELFSQNFMNATEQITPVNAKVATGQVPEWLKGDLVRVGPAKFDLEDNFTCNHWMDGLAMMHKFSFRDGKVTFSKRFVDSEAAKRCAKAGRPVFTEFGTKAYSDPTKGFFSRLVSSFDAACVTDNTTQNIMRVGNETFVTSETCYMRRVDHNTLETKEKVDLHKIAGINFAAAHVLTDETGTSYNIGMTIFSGPKYHILKTPPSNNNKGKDVWLNTKVIATIPASWKASYSYIHSFGMTENYIIFMEQPLLINTFKLATSQVKGRSLHECIEWHPQELNKFIVVNKRTGEVHKTKFITDEAFFALHHVNAYEVKGQIVLDIITYPTADIVDKLYLEKVRNNTYSDDGPSQLMRFVLPLFDDIQNVAEDQELANVPNCTASAMRDRNNQHGDFVRVSGMYIGEPGIDMPTFDPMRRSKPYRYAYCNGGFDQGYYKNAACKIDVETGLTTLWRESEYQYPSEPMFVPRPGATDEEDGVVLVPVVETREGVPHVLLILDAKTFSEVARIETKEAIPNGLHGIFIPDGPSIY